MKNIVLTGFMATGKTSVGKLVANKLNLMFYDTDSIIEEQENRKVTEIFDEFGEKYFRELENKLAITLMSVENAVISTGGGFVVNAQNIELMRQNGVIVNIKTTPEIIEARYLKAKETRPLMQRDSVEEVIERFNQRKIYYNNNDICIKLTKDMTVEECADLVVSAYNEFVENN